MIAAAPARTAQPMAEISPQERTIYEHVALQALEKLAQDHNAAPLAALAADLAKLPVDETRLVPVVRSISREITKLDNPGAVPLIEALLDIKWSTLSPVAVDTYVRFLSILASGIPRWWSEIANKVIAEFVLPIQATGPHHTVIGHILQLIPTSAPRFTQIFTQNFPHVLAGRDETVNYVRNLLRVTEYRPEQKRPVWQLVVERLVHLDVQCADQDDQDDSESEASNSDSDGDQEDDHGEDSDDDYSENDVDSMTKNDQDAATDLATDPATDPEVNEPPSKRIRMDSDLADGEEVTEAELYQNDMANTEALAEKLDVVLSELLGYLDTQFEINALQSGFATPLFILLLDTFKEYVLPTHTTRASQYIMFHVAHTHGDLLDAFLVALIDLALSPTQPPDRRQKAMQYIASFVARAKGLSRAQVVFVVSFLASWVKRYVAERESEVDSAPSMARFRIFYAAVQALFYIFCFRHSMLRKQDGSGAWESNLDKLFQRLITTKFNPLKYCKSTVVAMFARIARNEDVAYCFSVIEQNRVGRFRAASATNGGGFKSAATGELGRLSSVLWPNRRDFAVLESFFPFDPLLLPRSRQFIGDQYVEWADVASFSESDSSVSSDDESDSGTGSEVSSDSDAMSPSEPASDLE